METPQPPTTNKHVGFHYFVQPTDDMITKRRRLSEQSISNESTGDRLLTDSFKKLELQGINNFSSVSCPTPEHPKLLRLEEVVQFKSILLDQLGIQKYLTLDCDLKLSDIKANLRHPPTKPMFYAYGMPANFDFLVREGEQFLKHQMKEEDYRLTEHNDRERFIRNLNLVRPSRLSRQEREQKVLAYLQKKRTRQWKAVRYSFQMHPYKKRYFHRKRLAEQRERLQGRFVKSAHSKFISPELLSRSCESHSSAGEKKAIKQQQKQARPVCEL